MQIIVNHSQSLVKEITIVKNSVILGRGTNCDVVVDSDHLSRQHLEIKFKDGNIFVRDMTLSSWVSLNKEKLSKAELTLYQEMTPLVLPSGHEIQIKRTTENDEEMSGTSGKKVFYSDEESRLSTALKFLGAVVVLGLVISYIVFNV